MDDSPSFLTPMDDMQYDLTVDGFWVVARDIAARLHNGREDEVMDFLARCDIEDLRSLARLGGGRAIWQQDAALWLKMTRITIGRNVLLTEPPDGIRRRDAAFSTEMRAMADRCEGNAEGRTFILDEIVDLLAYPGMPLDEVLALLDWILSIRRMNGIADDHARYRNSSSLIACLATTADLIAAASKAECIFQEALAEYTRRTRELPASDRWLPWHDFFAQYPELFDRFHADVPDPALIERRWPHAAPEVRKTLGATLLGAINGDDAIAAADRLIRADEELFAALLREQGSLSSVPLAKLIWEKQYPALLPLLFPLMTNTRRAIDTHHDTLSAVLADQPALVLTAVPAQLDLLIPLLSTGQLRAMLPELGAMIAKSTSKAVRDAMVAASAALSIDDIRASGWLDVRNKNLRLTCRDILLTHPDKAGAMPLLTTMLADGGLDAAAASSLAAVLAPPDASTAPTLAELEAQAADIKRWSATIKPLEHAEVLALFQPLSEHAARAALHLAATGDDALPPLARALLAQLSTDNRARLALHAVQAWIASDGEPKLRWALRLLEGGADDRIVEPLAAAMLAWGKKSRYPRAVVALAQLSALDSPYALLRVMEAAESPALKGPVIEAAVDALDAAAKRRGCAMAELIDDLTPNFGLANGVTLTVGAHSYRIALQDDLTLRLADAKGKLLKSLPANKDDSIREAWHAAASRFATLAAAVKASARLQLPRLRSAFITGKSWDAQRWTRLFLEHPLLRIIARSLVWQASDLASFRIAEDFSLILADDAPFHLPPDARITLWHPAIAPAATWRAHLADYQLTPLIDQAGAPAALPPADRLSADRLLAPPGLRLTHEQLAGILGKHDYDAGLSGNMHAWPLRTARLDVRIVTGESQPFPSFNTPVDVEAVEVRDTANDDALVQTADWPRPLLATVWSHLLLLDAKRLA